MDWLCRTCLWKVTWWSVFSELYISQHKLSLFIHKTSAGWKENKDGITDLDSSSHSPLSDGCHCWSLLLLLLLLLFLLLFLWDFVDGNVDGDVYRPDNGADYDKWFLHTGGKKCCSNSCSSIFCKSSCARWAPPMIITSLLLSSECCRSMTINWILIITGYFCSVFPLFTVGAEMMMICMKELVVTKNYNACFGFV